MSFETIYYNSDVITPLVALYKTLVDHGKIAPYGWNDGIKVSFGLELSDSGDITHIIPLLEEETNEKTKKSRLVPTLMTLPAHAGRTHTCPYYLCDNSKYFLGSEEKKPEYFRASSDLHHQILDDVNAPAAKAILAFFDNWKPEDAKSNSKLREYWENLEKGSNLIFFYKRRPVTEYPELCTAWDRYYNKAAPDAKTGTCIITNTNGELAAVDPKIIGVFGGQASGTAISSYNCDSFCHYGKKQNYNAPMTKRTAFAFTSALNYLLANENLCKTVGGATIVCWTNSVSEQASEIAIDAVFGSVSSKSGDDRQDKITDMDLANFLESLSKGKLIDIGGISLNPNEDFYMLGLSGNGGRIVVDFSFKNTFGIFLKNVAQHYRNMAVIKPSFDNTVNVSLWQIIAATKRKGEKWDKNDSKLYAELLQSIVFGTEYPQEILDLMQVRIDADRDVSRAAAGYIKAYYLRNKYSDFPRGILGMEVNKNSNNVPYTLGRLFARMEELQYDVSPDVNATIKGRFFVMASDAPSDAFPIMNELCENYIDKLSKNGKEWLANHHANRLGELQAKLGEYYPRSLTQIEKGAFHLGYYHERQDHFNYIKEKRRNTEGFRESQQ